MARLCGRRGFVGRAFAFLATLLGSRPVVAAADSRSMRFAAHLAALVRDLPSAAVVGRECLHGLRGATLDSHLEALNRDVPGLLAALEANQIVLARGLAAARSRRDFDNGDVVLADGWMLSLTEARLYAVAALLEDGV